MSDRDDDIDWEVLRREAAGFPPTDESGDVDLYLVRSFLALTPAERLTRLEQFVASVQEVWRANGIRPWSDSATS